jgi:hypothetical protein
MLWGTVKMAFLSRFYRKQALYTVFFPRGISILLGEVQGFCGKTAKNLALEQRKTVLKALACKDNCVVQYTLFEFHGFYGRP